MTTLTLTHNGETLATFPCFINEDFYLEATVEESTLKEVNDRLMAAGNMEVFQATEIALCHYNEGNMLEGVLDSENPDGIRFAFSDL